MKTDLLPELTFVSSAGPIITPLVQSGKLKIVAARYDLDTGKVELLK